MKRIVITICSFFLLVSFSDGKTMYEMIQDGDLDAVRDSLNNLSTAAHRDGDILFYSALVEPDAEQAEKLLQASLNALVSASFREEIYYKLSQFYFINSDYNRLGRMIKEYQKYWENGKYRGFFLRMEAFLKERDKKYDQSIRELDRYLLQYNSGEMYQIGLIDKARCMNSYGKDVAAKKMLRTLSREKKGFGIPVALYMLADYSIDNNRTDDAVFFYNLMREKYPSSVGLDGTINRLTDMSASSDRDSRAEELTGTSYSVKVGVFSSKSNANRQADLFEKYDKKVQINKKRIGSKDYYVVSVGQFKSYLDADKFKEMLESYHKEVFQVITK